jgi:hypothetical protein
MYTHELFDSIRMGYSDISRPTKKQYTFGVELEIIVSDSVFDKKVAYDNMAKIIENNPDSRNSILKIYLNRMFDDKKEFSDFKAMEETIKYFEDITKAKRKRDFKLSYKKDRFNEYPVISSGDKSSSLHLDTSWSSFIQSVVFAYDWSHIKNSEKYKTFSKNYIEYLINKNKKSYIANAKLEYIKNSLKDFIDIERVELDSSVPEGGELVSEVYDDIGDFLYDLKSALDKINKDENLSTDMTTGLHINIGTWKSNEIFDLDILKFFLIADTMGILKDFNRIGSDYAVPVKDKLIYIIENMDMKEYEKISKEITSKILTKADKFDEINFSKLPYDGYIEVRGFGNADYEKRFGEIKTHILKLVRVLDISQDPNSYKNDYMKKLYKYLNPQNTDETGIENEILKDFKNWGKPANKTAFKFDVDSIESMAMWIRGLIESSRSNSTYLKKLGEKIPPMLSSNMIRYTISKKKTKSISFEYDFKVAQNIIRSVIHEYYLEYESPKLEKTLNRIFKL